MILKLLLALVTVTTAMPIYAQIFKLNVTDYGLGAGTPAFVNFVNAEISKIQNEINKDLPSAPPQRLMEGMANSSVMAGKGIGSDYASNMSVLLIGGAVGVGADLAKDKDTNSDISGVGVAPGLIIGTNLGFLDTRSILGMDTNRLNVYFNFMNYSLDKKISEEAGKESAANLKMLAMGIHIRYDWIKARGSKLLGWGGVKFHTGYEYNKTSIAFNSTINETVNETSSNGEVISGTISGKPAANILVNTGSIPVELSTDVQLLYILSLYTGLGLDYNFGQAKGDGALNAGNSPINCTGGVCGVGPGTTLQVKPEANIDATGKVETLLYRAFAGVQINLPWTRVFVQVDKSLSNDLVGATAGVRFVF
jgi:hypothetical protein